MASPGRGKVFRVLRDRGLSPGLAGDLLDIVKPASGLAISALDWAERIALECITNLNAYDGVRILFKNREFGPHRHRGVVEWVKEIPLLPVKSALDINDPDFRRMMDGVLLLLPFCIRRLGSSTPEQEEE